MSEKAQSLRKARNRRYYIKHAEQERARARQWRQEHPEEIEKNRKYYSNKRKLQGVK